MSPSHGEAKKGRENARRDDTAGDNRQGRPAESGAKMVAALQTKPKSPEEVARESGLRELALAGLAIEKDASTNLPGREQSRSGKGPENI